MARPAVVRPAVAVAEAPLTPADSALSAAPARPGAADVVFAGAACFASLRVPLTYSLKFVPARNRGTDVFFTLTDSPVAGLRAVRAARSRFSKTPKPVNTTFSPFTTERVMVSRTASTVLAV